MSPDQLKGYVDIVVSLLGAGGLCSIVLAVIGMRRGSKKEPEDDRPNLGHAGMHHLGGMLAGEHFGMEILSGIRLLAEALRFTGQTREANTRVAREIADERRADSRRLVEQLETMNDRLKDLRPKG